MPEITVYTRSTCAPCKMVKMWLNNKKFTFSERNVDEQPELISEIIKRTGYMQVPMILIGDTPVSGANFALLSKLLMV